MSSISRPARASVKDGPAKSSASEAYDLLITTIERGELTAGMRMREVELAERYGISRTPIREALKRLEARWLVTRTPNQGAVVTTLRPRTRHEFLRRACRRRARHTRARSGRHRGGRARMCAMPSSGV